MRYPWALAAFALLCSPLLSQTPPPEAPVERRVTVVPEDVTQIQEAGLDLDALLNGKAGSNSDMLGGKEPITSPTAADPAKKYEGVQMVEGTLERRSKGLRQFLFTLAPGETINFTLNGVPRGKMFFLLGIPALQTRDPLFGEVRFRNQRPQVLRETRMDFKNTLDRPYPLMLLLKGQTGVPFEIRIERKGASRP